MICKATYFWGERMHRRIWLLFWVGIFLLNATIGNSQHQLTPTASFLGTHDYERVGYHIHSAGDVNGDGYDDFLIGTFHNKTNGYNAGAVYLILGRPEANWGFNVSLLNADARFLGAKAYEAAGYFVGGKGDVNGDGLADMLIGAEDGHVYVVLGRRSANWGRDFVLYDEADARYDSEQDEDSAGLSVAIIGDLNGDGYDDFICGAPFHDYDGDDVGKAYLILGKASGWQRGVSLSQANASFYGTTNNGLVGYCVDGVGDVNNDGIPDFAIGARGEGKVYLFFGRRSVNWGKNCDIGTADVIFTAEQYGNYTGWRVSGAGDVNGDGFDDFLIAAPYHDENDNENGKVYLILGRSSGWKTHLSEADASFYGEGLDDEAGWDTQGAGDVDGDGYDDFLIGAWYNDANGTDAGKMYLIKGKSSGWQRNVSLATIEDYFVGQHPGDYAGFSCASAGDVNGDGVPDIITSATYYSEAFYWGGIIYLIVSDHANITVTAPNGGETWTIGNNYHITWTSSRTSGNVKIEYSPNSGGSWKTIVSSTPDDGDYLWTIPNDPTTSCLVRITDCDGDPSDVSDAVFTLALGNYTLTMAVQPNGSGTTDPPIGNHSYASATVVTIIATSATGYHFSHWDGDVADPNNDTTSVTMNGNKTVTANFVPQTTTPITDLRASQQWNQILLEWSPVTGASGYNVYRGTSYDFIPDMASGGNRIGTNVSDQDPNTSGIQWLDNGAGVKLIGDVNVNYFYRVTAIVGSESEPSNLAGEFDCNLVTTATTDINHLVVIMNTQQTRKPIATAEDLAQAISYCSDVYCWDAATQSLIGHVKGLPFNNFPILTGYPYMVSVTKDTVWTIAGSYSDASFQLMTTDKTDINHIGVPLGKSNLTTAEQLGQDIPNCTDVYVWDIAAQALIGHVVGLPVNNFAVQPGHAYFVNVTADGNWPASGQNMGMSASALIPINSLPAIRKASGQLSHGVPHTVYGQLHSPKGSLVAASDLQINVQWKRNGSSILVSNPIGSGWDGEFWWLMVTNFAPTWQPGDTLIVELAQTNGRYRGCTHVILSDAGSDDAGGVELTEWQEYETVIKATQRSRFQVWQNSPNPFNPETSIRFELTSRDQVRINIYDVAGRLVTALLNQELPPGNHQIVWNGRDHRGRLVSSGIYFCRLEAGGHFETVKLMLAR